MAAISHLRIVAVLVAAACGIRVQAQSSSPGAAYEIYAGSVHAHTSYTWSHGDQWPKPAPGEKNKPLRITAEGAQHPPEGKEPRSDWEKHQGPPGEHFKRAKAAGYDFYVSTDHSQEAGLQPPARENPQWVDTLRAAAEATDESFVALAGVEHSENNGPGGTGHINVINSAEYLNALSPGVDLPRLYEWLKTAAPAGEGPVVASFNHPGARQYDDWGHRDEGVTEVITMLEVINSNNKIHYEGFVRALDKGWRVSPVCGNDNHGFWGIGNQTSRTFVLATARTRAGILDAMKNRRTYAALEKNVRCRYSVNGAVMGSTVERAGELRFEISVSDPDTGEPGDRITKLDIVSDGGAVVEAYSPAEPGHSVTWRPTVKGPTGKYYFVRLWNAGGGDAPKGDPAKPVAWLAPVWVGR